MRQPVDGRALTRRGFLAGGLGAAGATLLARPPAGSLAEAADPGLDFASAVAAARAIERRQVSSVEITRRMLDRIDRYNPALNAMVNVLREPLAEVVGGFRPPPGYGA